MRPVENEHRVHFAGRDPVGEPRRDERAGTHADVKIEIGQVDASERLLERDRARRSRRCRRGDRPPRGRSPLCRCDAARSSEPPRASYVPLDHLSERAAAALFGFGFRPVPPRAAGLSSTSGDSFFGDLRQFGDPLASGRRRPCGSGRSGCAARARPGPRTPARACPRFPSPSTASRQAARRRRSWSFPGPSRLPRPAPRTSSRLLAGPWRTRRGRRARSGSRIRGFSPPVGFPSPRWRVPSVSLA